MFATFSKTSKGPQLKISPPPKPNGEFWKDFAMPSRSKLNRGVPSLIICHPSFEYQILSSTLAASGCTLEV